MIGTFQIKIQNLITLIKIETMKMMKMMHQYY